MEFSASKDRSMSAVAAQTDLRAIAAEEWPRLNHKGRLRELARLLPDWTRRRVRAVYNAEEGVSLRADERAAIDALRRKEAEDARRTADTEYRVLEARIAALEAYFAAGDEDFGSQHLAALRASFDGAGESPDRSGARNGAGNSAQRIGGAGPEEAAEAQRLLRPVRPLTLSERRRHQYHDEDTDV